MPRPEQPPVELSVMLHHQTERAWLVSNDGVKEHAVWVPKSQCELDPAVVGRQGALSIPEWLATEKGLA